MDGGEGGGEDTETIRIQGNSMDHEDSIEHGLSRFHPEVGFQVSIQKVIGRQYYFGVTAVQVGHVFVVAMSII